MTRLLIVEDDSSQLQTLSDILRDEGFDVLGCPSATEALRHVAEDSFGVAILDQRLPDLEGTKLLKRIHELNGQVRVIIHTAYGSFDSAKEAVNFGAFAYVEKLADPGELVRQVHRAVADQVQRYARELEAAVAERTLALQQSEKKYRDLVETSNDLIWAVDAAGRWTFVNAKAARRIYGCEPAEMLGRPFTDFAAPEQARQDLEVFAQVKAGRPTFNYETCHRRKDGGPVYLRFNAIVLRDEGGGVIGATGTASDITEARRLEEELRQSQKMEAIGRLAGGVAHDFNNLLTVINGYSSLMLAGGQPLELWHRFLEEIHKAGNRAADLTGQLLSFSRKQVLQLQVLDLNGVVGNISQMLRRLIGEDIELIVHLEPALWPVKSDPARIEQVLLNLAANARDAMPQGGRLTIATANRRLGPDEARLHADLAPGPYVQLTVADTGGGMDEATRARVFEPFFTTKEVGRGTGLGLASVYGIVRQSGGQVGVESALGQGATFTILLPAAESAAAAGAPADALADLPRGSETVLLVEDEERVRNFARQVLEQAGYTVLAADDGPDAIALSQCHPGPIELVVADVIMPRMNGPDLVRHLRLARSGIRVLYVSGYLDHTVFDRDQLLADAALIPKPFSPAALARTVRDVLDRKPRQPG